MWPVLMIIGLLLCGLLLIAHTLRAAQQADTTRRRLHSGGDEASADLFEEVAIPAGPAVPRYRWLIPVVVPIACGVGLFTIPWPEPYVLVLGVMSGLLLWQLEAWWYQQRMSRIEQQLADSIDMMVAAVKSGASLQGAMESAMENTTRPWKNELRYTLSQIRYGDDPIEVLTELGERIPLETVRLFSQTLAVNWTVGGRLSVVLANVSRTIRDRIELSHRMRAMTTQARLSVMSVILVTYFLGALMWRNDPERMVGFLTSLIGQGLVVTAMLLQAIGIVWITRLSTPRF